MARVLLPVDFVSLKTTLDGMLFILAKYDRG